MRNIYTQEDEALISYKLTEKFSISKASEKINQGQVLDIF